MKKMYLTELFVSFVFCVVGIMSLFTDVSSTFFWAVVAYSPWVFVPAIIIVGLALISFSMSKNEPGYCHDLAENSPFKRSKEDLQEEIRKDQNLGILAKIPPFIMLIAGCAMVASSFIPLFYGLMFVTYSLLRISTIDFINRYNFEKDMIEWK